MAIEQFDGAEESYSKALELDPSIRRSKSFKVLFILFIRFSALYAVTHEKN